MEQFINTFQNGMHRDYSVHLQPDGTYRWGKNISLVSQDGNNFVIKDSLGNLKTFTIPIRYRADGLAFNEGVPMPIGFISFPDKLIVFFTSDETEVGGYGEIGQLDYLPYGEGIQPKAVTGQLQSGYTPLYHHTSLKFSKAHRIEGFGFTESELVERIYWTDNNNEPRVFNVSDPVFTTYFTPTVILGNPLVVGNQYMVLEGIIEHPVLSGSLYGPGLTLGNIFTASTNTYTETTGSAPIPKVIEYFPYQLLNFTPARALGNITFKTYGTGSVYCGSKMYFYRLTTADQNYTTPWSYGSGLIHVGHDNDSSFIRFIPYFDFVGDGTSTLAVNSGKSVIVTIDGIDLNYGKIELAVAEFDNSNESPRSISIVNQLDITGSSMDIEHTGILGLGALTLADLTLFPASILKIKTLSTNKNYLLGGNFTEREEFDSALFDLGNVTVQSFEYPMNVYGDPETCSNAVIYDDVSPGYSSPGVGDVTPWSRWYVTLGDLGANTVSYNGTNYVTGEVITGIAGVTSILRTGSAEVRPCVTRNKYTNRLTSKRVEHAILLEDDNVRFWDYKSAAVHQHCTGYWSNETYRFGLMLYDLKGNPFYVKHIADYQMPDANSKGGLLLSDSYAGGNFYSVNPSGVKFGNIIIPSSVIDQISGFSIVRAERVARIITQGLVTHAVHTGASPDVSRPASYVPASFDQFQVAPLTYCYICPDNLVDAPLKNLIGVPGDSMESVCWYDAYPFGGTNPVRGKDGQEQIVTKFIEPLSADLTLRTGTITYFDYFDENASKSNLPGGATFNNDMQVGSAGTAPDFGCTVPNIAYDIDTFESVGGKKIVFQLQSDFLHYSSGSGFTDNAVNTKTERLLMNYVKANLSNPYGNTQDTLYITTGHFQPINSTVKAQTLNGAGNYQFDNVEVFGGDCYTCFIDQAYGVYWSSFAASYSYGWSFPCECNSNYNLRRGRKVSNVGMKYFTAPPPEAISMDDGKLESYRYNKGYSTEGQFIRYPALPDNFLNANKFKFRIRYAGLKTIGEVRDSFRTFAVGDFKDLDGQGGEINNIKVKDGRVVVWQNKLTSTIPILERQLLGGVDGAATTIGTGGVVDRFDPISSYFGNQHQWSLTETEYGFAWFDMRKKALVILGFDGTGLAEISQAEGMKSYFDEIFVEAFGTNTLSTTNLLNSPTFSETSDRPLLGVGITGVFDPKFKMTYMTFKFMERKPVSSNISYINKDFTIGYLHTRSRKCFVAFYDFTPAIAHNHNQFVIAANNPKNTTKYFGTNMATTDFVVGEITQFGPYEMMCIQDATGVTFSAINPKSPSFNAGLATAYWTPVNTTNELWVNNQPNALSLATAPDYIYNSWFGRATSNELEYIINPSPGGKLPPPFNVTHMEQLGNLVNITDLTISDDQRTASDTSIKAWNKNYRAIYDRICSSMPIAETIGASGRVIGSYLKVRMVKKNWTVPTTVDKAVRILNQVVSFFNFRR